MTMTAQIAELHCVSFAREKRDLVARCTCGWLKRGAAGDVYNAAAYHDLLQWDLDEKTEPIKSES